MFKDFSYQWTYIHCRHPFELKRFSQNTLSSQELVFPYFFTTEFTFLSCKKNQMQNIFAFFDFMKCPRNCFYCAICFFSDSMSSDTSLGLALIWDFYISTSSSINNKDVNILSDTSVPTYTLVTILSSVYELSQVTLPPAHFQLWHASQVQHSQEEQLQLLFGICLRFFLPGIASFAFVMISPKVKVTSIRIR